MSISGNCNGFFYFFSWFREPFLLWTLLINWVRCPSFRISFVPEPSCSQQQIGEHVNLICFSSILQWDYHTFILCCRWTGVVVFGARVCELYWRPLVSPASTCRQARGWAGAWADSALLIEWDGVVDAVHPSVCAGRRSIWQERWGLCGFVRLHIAIQCLTIELKREYFVVKSVLSYCKWCLAMEVATIMPASMMVFYIVMILFDWHFCLHGIDWCKRKVWEICNTFIFLFMKDEGNRWVVNLIVLSSGRQYATEQEH
jgi:hypothetical protein